MLCKKCQERGDFGNIDFFIQDKWKDDKRNEEKMWKSISGFSLVNIFQ